MVCAVLRKMKNWWERLRCAAYSYKPACCRRPFKGLLIGFYRDGGEAHTRTVHKDENLALLDGDACSARDNLPRALSRSWTTCHHTAQNIVYVVSEFLRHAHVCNDARFLLLPLRERGIPSNRVYCLLPFRRAGKNSLHSLLQIPTIAIRNSGGEDSRSSACYVP